MLEQKSFNTCLTIIEEISLVKSNVLEVYRAPVILF